MFNIVKVAAREAFDIIWTALKSAIVCVKIALLVVAKYLKTSARYIGSFAKIIDAFAITFLDGLLQILFIIGVFTAPILLLFDPLDVTSGLASHIGKIAANMVIYIFAAFLLVLNLLVVKEILRRSSEPSAEKENSVSNGVWPRVWKLFLRSLWILLLVGLLLYRLVLVDEMQRNIERNEMIAKLNEGLKRDLRELVPIADVFPSVSFSGYGFAQMDAANTYKKLWIALENNTEKLMSNVAVRKKCGEKLKQIRNTIIVNVENIGWCESETDCLWLERYEARKQEISYLIANLETCVDGKFHIKW